MFPCDEILLGALGLILSFFVFQNPSSDIDHLRISAILTQYAASESLPSDTNDKSSIQAPSLFRQGTYADKFINTKWIPRCGASV
jgi:hypothetical protein